ncbi:S1/P1 nuclease [Rheinheimera salexigens]|uniref:Endonuclease n=1 Tax=Rheinheimera salexigens TaxID=1628148 RepID=A0A1E7Q6S3_9GAMM|nr:S1/P1 nuclease [Rheinheimera salexigens]OEY69892.1 endonuclease [Rheinheimera salexigens]
MRIIFLLLLAVSSQQVFAFGQTGHKMICDMAYQLSQPQTQAHIDNLVQTSGLDSFAEGCVWPDTIRNDDGFKWSSPLHYVNFPRHKSTISHSDCAQQGCVLSAIDDMQRRLSHDAYDWQALMFLAHFIADLHQPLHVSFADDLGGNKTEVSFYLQPTNLHSVWDSRILAKLGYNDNRIKQQQLLHAIDSRQAYQWQQTDALAWANESAAITTHIYAQYQPNMQLADTYVQQNQAKIEMRIQQAAVRLAFILDQAFNYRP